MSLLKVASAGCRQLVGVVDSATAIVSFLLQLNQALASRLVAILWASVNTAIYLLNRLTAGIRIAVSDGVAFLGDIGDLVQAVTDLICSVVLEVGRAMVEMVTGMFTAILNLVQTVVNFMAACCLCVNSLILTIYKSLVLIYETVIYLLTMIPYCILYSIMYCFLCLEDCIKTIIFGCISSVDASVNFVIETVKGVAREVLSIPPAAAVGALLVVLAAYGLRRLFRLVSSGALPAPRLDRPAAAALRASRRLAAAALAGLGHLAVPLGVTAARLVISAADGLRQAARPCRLAVRVVAAAAHIAARCLRAFVQNVALGLRLGLAARRAPRPLLADPEPEQEQEPRPEPATPRRRLRAKAGGRSPAPQRGGDAESRLCVVCLSQEKSVILLPCRHVCLCEPCGRAVGAGDRRCPMCRTPIVDALRVFL